MTTSTLSKSSPQLGGQAKALRPCDLRHRGSKASLWLESEQNLAWSNSQPVTWAANIRKPAQPEALLLQTGCSSRVALYAGNLEFGICRQLCENGQIGDAVEALTHLVHQGCHIPNNLFYRVLKPCIAQKELVLGRRIHSLSIKSGYEGDAFLGTHLMGLYASLGRLDEVRRVFAKVSAPDAYNWATIIFAHARNGEPTHAIHLYRQMRDSCIKPDNHVFLAVLKACATVGDLAAGKDVHADVLASSSKPDIYVQTGLIDMYAKCGSLEDARRLFDKLRKRDVVLWNTMIAGYAQQGLGEDALGLYTAMQQEGIAEPTAVTFVSLLQACASVGEGALDEGKRIHKQIEERRLHDDLVLGGSLVNMFAKCGCIEDARRLFDRLRRKNVWTWNAMIAGYTQHGMDQEALDVYTRMKQEGITHPDSATIVCLLHACAGLADLPLGKQLHAQIEQLGLQADVVVGTALVNTYAKCGSMVDSQQAFDALRERNIEAWGALIAGYTRQGDSNAVLNLLERMKLEGIQPNCIIFLNVLTVCSHVGLVDKGRKAFEAMKSDYGITPTVEHYTCLMDLLGRAGHLDEALELAISMPLQADIAVWDTLLSACRKWNNVDVGRQVFARAVSMDAKNASHYVLMTSIYAEAQMWEEVRAMQARRKEVMAWKEQGESWCNSLGGGVHTFAVGDKQHRQQEEGVLAQWE